MSSGAGFRCRLVARSRVRADDQVVAWQGVDHFADAVVGECSVEGFDELGGGEVPHPMSGFDVATPSATRNMGLAGAGSDGDRLQHIRAALPCDVRVTAAIHPLFGRLLAARDFRRVDGVVLLVVELPDGSPGTIRVEATDLLGMDPGVAVVTVLDVEGLRALSGLVRTLQTRPRIPARPRNGK